MHVVQFLKVEIYRENTFAMSGQTENTGKRLYRMEGRLGLNHQMYNISCTIDSFRDVTLLVR